MQHQLRNAQQVKASHGAFAVVLADGSVVTRAVVDGKRR